MELQNVIAEVQSTPMVQGQSTLPFFIVFPFYFLSAYTQWAFILLGGIAFQVLVWVYGALNWTYHFIVSVLFFWCMPCRFLLDWTENIITLPFEIFEWTWGLLLWIIDFAFVWWIKLFFWEGDDEENADEDEAAEDDAVEEESSAEEMMRQLTKLTDQGRSTLMNPGPLYHKNLRTMLTKKFEPKNYSGTTFLDLYAVHDNAQCALSKFFA
eukprot:CAMPEP_0176369926 /NCGR_PEP_ID=MMETSP0126-20121128/23626_1 /TAXON_ID=141414 ORGANISM="Strombidinopsis acuminatum, Strain SPMC142" /NCGR_SAMPLE_ID=MMETSP0126 /ASSEMBLY_ACC=CAM_ASM_000229 /LENGTH=210 /DNA_ID=CAMNT_0017728751 /DNA_START=33 /DNA_END=665 /DNA_ORIENTATION=+